MPRKDRDKRKRDAYRPDQAKAIVELEAKRIRLGVSVDRMVSQAGISRQTWFSMKRDGRAFRRHVKALTFALRTIGRELQAEDQVL